MNRIKRINKISLLYSRTAEYSDTIDRNSTSPYANDDQYSCKFADHTLRHGDKLRSDDKCLECECSTPPFITCTKSNKC